MDNLAREAMLAKQANMSYGKWKALHYVPTKEIPVVERNDEYAVKCLGCGNIFYKSNKRRRLYCTDSCRDRYKYLQRCGNGKA